MRFKRKMFFTLILFLMIFSISFVNANELTQGTNTGDGSTLSASIDDSLDDIRLDSVNISTSSKLDLSGDVQNTDEIDYCLTNEFQILRANNDEQILGAGTPYVDNTTFANGGTAQQVIERIRDLSNQYGDSGGAILYLNGQTFSGGGTLQADYQILTIKNVKVIGGSVDNPTKMATFTNQGLVFNFRGRSADWGTKFYANSGYNLVNVSFYYLNAEYTFLQFAGGGSLTDCVVDHCQ